jgi:acetyl esterase/lipase
MGKFGMFDTAEERDAFVAERDRLIAEEAAALAHIGITGPDDLVAKYSALCHLYEAGWVPEPGEILSTSDEAREFADRVLVIKHGGAWRSGNDDDPER